MEKRPEAAEVWSWRKMIRMWVEKIMDRDILDKIAMRRPLLNTISRRQWGFIKHELRGGGIERKTMEVKMAGKRARGRERLKMLDWMMKKLGVRDGK